MTTRLDISIGPVQGFVAQSRRTRDLWGSSYLLAFLSAHAMHGAATAGGKLVQPVVDGDPLYGWVAGSRSGDPPRFGTVPNHFAVEVGGDAENAARPVAEAAGRSLRLAWKRVCDAVWQRFVADASAAGRDTAAIWGRQVGSFWDVVWTAGPPCGGLLARRKHWRSHRPPEEPGDKCTVMHDLQELSGYVRAHDRAEQDDFWCRMKCRLGELDLRDDERLCAVALVKRLFPKVGSEALGWNMDTSHWPSTVYLGAVPWIRRVGVAVPNQADQYAEAVKHRAGGGVFPMAKGLPFGLSTPVAGNFPTLDANYLHRDSVSNARLCPLTSGTAAAARKELDGLLKAIYDTVDQGRRLGPPPTFYALVLADGDELGKLVGRIGGDEASRALALFTCAVPDLAAKHVGMTVYSGGDDVLCMLAAPDALAFAQALSDAYRSAFDRVGAQEATLSAAVVFAHVRMPLNQVLGEAHRLLDDVAKDGNGRNSVVAAVLKPSGPYCQWATTWVRHGLDGDTRAVASIQRLKRQIGTNATEPGLSSTLVYRIRDTLCRLCGWDQWQPGDWGAVPQDIDVRSFLRAELQHSMDVRMDHGAESRADDLAAEVWNLLVRSRNVRTHATNAPADTNTDREPTQAGVDALLLARFLADPGEATESGSFDG